MSESGSGAVAAIFVAGAAGGGPSVGGRGNGNVGGVGGDIVVVGEDRGGGDFNTGLHGWCHDGGNAGTAAVCDHVAGFAGGVGGDGGCAGGICIGVFDSGGDGGCGGGAGGAGGSCGGAGGAD